MESSPGVDHAIVVDAGDFTQRSLLIWHTLFGVMVAAAAILTTADGYGAWTLPLLLVLVVAYVVIGLPAGRREDRRLSWLYLLIAYSIVVLLTWRDPSSLVLLFAIYPQGFLLLERRDAIVATVLVSLAFTLTLAARDGFTRESLEGNALVAVGNIVFALVIGLFIDGLVRESQRRKALVLELQATRSELAAAEREAGAVAERERIARDIHDTLAQGFTSIVMLAQAGQAAAGARPDEALRRLREIEAQARDGLAEARALVGAMTPPALEGGGLAQAVQRLVERFSAETGTPASFRLEGDPAPLAASSDVAALRATQEALANARRHAGARRVDVVLAYDEDGATVSVTDDGQGFDPAAPRHGYGLDGLAGRVQAVGGLVSVESAPGEGTRVRVRVP
ncbi:MAG: sensor histidine kinase [Candidatus Nanopelagicales bacterium]